MLQIINSMSDRLLGLVAPKATVSALDCGSTVWRAFCVNNHVRWCKCFTNTNCACLSSTCYTTTTSC